MIGLCYREGTKDLLFEEVLKTEGIPYKRVYDPMKFSKLKGLIIGEGYEYWTKELIQFVKSGGILLVSKPQGQLAKELGLKLVGQQYGGYILIEDEEISKICSYEVISSWLRFN